MAPGSVIPAETDILFDSPSVRPGRSSAQRGKKMMLSQQGCEHAISTTACLVQRDPKLEQGYVIFGYGWNLSRYVMNNSVVEIKRFDFAPLFFSVGPSVPSNLGSESLRYALFSTNVDLFMSDSVAPRCTTGTPLSRPQILLPI